MKSKRLIITTLLLMVLCVVLIASIGVCYAEEELPTEVVTPAVPPVEEVTPPIEETTPPTEEVAPPTEEEKNPTNDGEKNTADEWWAYIKETIIPAVTLALTNLAGMLVMYLPAILTTLSSLKKIFVDWKGATSEIKSVLEMNDKNVEQIKELESKLDNATSIIDRLVGIVATMETKMTIAFANDERMVASGKAKAICDVDEKGDVSNGESEETAQ